MICIRESCLPQDGNYVTQCNISDYVVKKRNYPLNDTEFVQRVKFVCTTSSVFIGLQNVLLETRYINFDIFTGGSGHNNSSKNCEKQIKIYFEKENLNTVVKTLYPNPLNLVFFFHAADMV